MNIFNSFAQAAEYTTPPTLSPEEVAAAVTILMTLFVIVLIIAIGLYVFIALCLVKIFKKAGVDKPWAAWVPFYNHWKMLEIGGQQGYWAVLVIVPIVGIVSAVFTFMAQYKIGKSLGKSSEFVLFAIFLPYIWFPWLAFDKSTWRK